MPRRHTYRKLALLIGGPMLVELTVMALWFWMLMEATKGQDKKPFEQMWITAAGAIGYCLSAFAAGRWVTTRIAPWLMGSMLGLGAAAGLAGIGLGRFEGFVAATFLMGACIGHYYVPFQINMGRVRPFETLAYSIACYNIAWGLGGAIGPFFGGVLRDLGLGYESFVLVVVGLVVAHGLLLGLSRTPEPDDPPPTAAFESTGRQRKFAWINFFIVGLAFRGLYGTLWPDLGKQMQWADWKIGLGQTLMLFPVAGAALVWARCRNRLIEPWFMIGSMAVGAAAFAILPWMPNWPTAVACCLLIGVMESCVVYHSLYYANADAHTKGRSLGIAETMA
ncbi:MAG: MFS transporter, partial [Phycisphaeraceae bacterium]|nr:MFS transporter [Phycisphaeraceae bacterium]